MKEITIRFSDESYAAFRDALGVRIMMDHDHGPVDSFAKFVVLAVDTKHDTLDITVLE